MKPNSSAAPQERKGERPFLPDPWPDLVVGIIGAVDGPCSDCCTAKTDGDLCERCHGLFDAVDFVIRSTVEAQRAELERLRAQVVELRGGKAMLRQTAETLRRTLEGLRAQVVGLEQENEALKQRNARQAVRLGDCPHCLEAVIFSDDDEELDRRATEYRRERDAALSAYRAPKDAVLHNSCADEETK